MNLKGALFAGTALGLWVNAPAGAQVTPSAPTSNAAETAVAAADAATADPAGATDIVITGSRIQGTYNSPTPVTTVSQADLVAAAPSTLAEGLKQLPSITPGGGPSAGGGTANGGQNFINLRALGNTRTLTLVDGRRFVPSNPTNLIDTNLIPQGLVDRVDVVTGGASAAYGSDAVGGVINFILNKRFVGLKAEVQFGISQRSDNAEKKFAITYGGSFLDDRLHLVAAGEYYKSDGVPGDAREFRRTAPNQLANPQGTPKLVRGTDLRTPFTTGGLVVIGQGGTTAANNQIKGIMFGANGVPTAYDYGTIASDIGLTSGSQNGGDGFRVSTGQEIIRPLERKTLFGHLEYDATDHVQIYVEGTYGKSLAQFQSSPTTGTLTIQRSNPYLAQAAPALVTQMTTLGVTRFLLNRLTLEDGLTIQDNENETIRLLGGLSGKIADNWSWDISYQYGRNDNHNPMRSNLITANMTRAVNAVTSGGQIVCADTISTDAAVRAAAAGCQPFNPFGAGAPSQAALDYVFGVSVFDTRVVQKAADANLSGRLIDLPAGPLSVAVGAEWREISARTIADPLSNAGAFRLVNQQDFFGKYNIKEVYGEFQIPVLKDSFLGPSLDLNLAGRHTVYSTSGAVNTWKAGINWQILDSLRFRGTRSRDIRAPNLSELFATGRQNNITIDDTLRTGRTYLSVPNRTFGNSALTPEIADTLVLGLVFKPSFIRNLNLAVDFYDIKIKDVISNVGGNNANVECNRSNGTSPICAFITRDPATQAVIATRTSPLNLTEQRTKGVDMEASYRIPLDEKAGRLTIRGLASYVKENITYSPLIAVPINDAGNGTASLPHWRGTMSLNYSIGQFSAFTQARYIGAMVWDKSRVLGVDTDFNHISPQVYVDAQFSVKIPAFGKDQEFYLNIANLLDKKPPYDPSVGGATPLPTDPNLFDQVGRMFRVGARMRF
ncbi:MAG: TonB-dependent receptor [Sphingobium sp.]|nr:TonB-dependent receptor [Sphingobium sp.]